MTNVELMKVMGGIKYSKIGILGGVIVFLLGVLDGYINPNKCNK